MVPEKPFQNPDVDIGSHGEQTAFVETAVLDFPWRHLSSNIRAGSICWAKVQRGSRHNDGGIPKFGERG